MPPASRSTMSSKEGASRTGAALALSVVAPGGPTTLARLVDDYLAAGRAAGAAPRTIRVSYGFLVREAFLPWAPDHGLTESAQVDNAVLDRSRSTCATTEEEWA